MCRGTRASNRMQRIMQSPDLMPNVRYLSREFGGGFVVRAWIVTPVVSDRH